MRIISKFQDYYDGVQAYGHDETLCYVRKKTKIKISDPFSITDEESIETKNPELEKEILKLIGTRNIRAIHLDDLDSDIFLIGFCGNIYRGLQHRECSAKTGYKTILHNFYSTAEFETFLKAKPERKPYLKEFYRTPQLFKWTKYLSPSYEENFNNFFNEEVKSNNPIRNIFVDYNVPVFSVSVNSLVLNPCLKNFSFFKQVNTFTAFQEIDMFLGGVLGVGEPNMVEISDECMKQKKGFNDWSFKKLPTKKRK